MTERKYTKVEGSTTFWKPDGVGEEIEGEVIYVDKDDFGLVVRIKSGNDEVTLPSHKVLQNRLSAVKVRDFVKIQYTGEELPKIKGNNPTKMYDVWIDAQ